MLYIKSKLILLFFGLTLFISCKEEMNKGREDSTLKKIDFKEFDNLQKNGGEKPKKKQTINQEDENIHSIKDCFIWKTPYSTEFNRLFYGKVKSSEEIMYKMYQDNNGKYNPSNERYYTTGEEISIWGIKVEFDSLKRKKRYIDNLKTSNNTVKWGGIEFIYDSLNRLKRENFLKKDNNRFFSKNSYDYIFKNGINPICQLHKEYDYNDGNSLLKDSISYEYDDKGLLTNKKWYSLGYNNKGPLKLEKDYGYSKNEYNKEGKIIRSSHSSGEVTVYNYTNEKLSSKVVTYGNLKDEYYYYSTGVIKRANLQSTVMTGDVLFNKTGDITHYNGKEVRTYSDYDKYGNWRTRISYDEKGNPETYTNRAIEYYE